MVVDKSGTWFLMRRGDCAGSAGVAEPKAAASWCTPATQWLHQPPRILFSTGVGLPPHSINVWLSCHDREQSGIHKEP